MNEKKKLEDVVSDNNAKLTGVCEILSELILEGNPKGATLYCIEAIIEDVVKSQTQVSQTW